MELCHFHHQGHVIIYLSKKYHGADAHFWVQFADETTSDRDRHQYQGNLSSSLQRFLQVPRFPG